MCVGTEGIDGEPWHAQEARFKKFEHVLGLGYVPGNMNIMQGVKKLPPACAAIYDLGRNTLNIWRYWSLPEAHSDDDADIELSADELQILLLSRYGGAWRRMFRWE